jgi:hypothetical protein
MPPTQPPSDGRAQFDAICAQLDDFDPLPTVTPRPADNGRNNGHKLEDEEQTAPLDELILAGLVVPY